MPKISENERRQSWSSNLRLPSSKNLQTWQAHLQVWQSWSSSLPSLELQPSIAPVQSRRKRRGRQYAWHAPWFGAVGRCLAGLERRSWALKTQPSPSPTQQVGGSDGKNHSILGRQEIEPFCEPYVGTKKPGVKNLCAGGWKIVKEGLSMVQVVGGMPTTFWCNRDLVANPCGENNVIMSWPWSWHDHTSSQKQQHMHRCPSLRWGVSEVE